MEQEKSFSHLDAAGNPAMVDVSAKTETKRVAQARSIVVLGAEVMQHLVQVDIQT